jgi:hypothetical protein
MCALLLITHRPLNKCKRLTIARHLGRSRADFAVRWGMAQLIREHHTHVRTPEGLIYVPRTLADQKEDRMWEAWIEFRPLDGDSPRLRTDPETTQSTLDDVEVWAAGLESTYFEGAFARARLVPSP